MVSLFCLRYFPLDWSDERVAALIEFLDEANDVANRLADDLAPGGGGRN